MSFKEKGFGALLKFKWQKRHQSICQSGNTIMELFKYQNKTRLGLTKWKEGRPFSSINVPILEDVKSGWTI